jgi:hypothetical protein
MLKQSVGFAFLFVALTTGTALAQQCLHGANEIPDQAARRREALTAARTVNNIQANQPGAVNRSYFRHVDLGGTAFAAKMRESTSETVRRILLGPADEILPKWKLTLDVTQDGYWFMIKDLSDPCGFAYISNQAGVIFNSEPIR